MKIHNIKFIKLSLFAAIFVLLIAGGCKEDDPIGMDPTVDLETLIAEAEDLVANSVEGTSPGDFQPGSVQKLDDVLTWVQWQIDNATEDKEISDAAIKLHVQIEKFKESTVQLAIPIFNEEQGSYIQISDNVKTLFAEPFTLEIEAYFIATNATKNLFSMEGDNGGSPFGFTLRNEGAFQLVVGNGGWAVGGASSGAVQIGEWVHYAVTHDGTNWKVYKNGVEVISLVASGMIIDASTPFVLGNGSFWGNRPFKGLLRDFRVWSGVRTPEQLIANKDESLEGTEEGLKAYFPMDANLGNEFKDNTGNYTATIVGGGVAWAPDGIPPVIELDFSTLDAAIANAQEMKESVVEGENDGDYPVGTKDFIQTAIDNAVAVKESAEKQDEVDAAATALSGAIENVEDNLVADAMGVYIDREDPDAVGLRITPNFTPTTDFTIEFDIKLKTLMLESGDNGEIFCNGSIGLRYFGYNEPTEANIIASGGLWNFNNVGGWAGPQAPALTMKSGVWQHVAIVHVQADSTNTIYVDGVEVGQQTGMATPGIPGDDGIWVGNYWSKMNGSIKDWRMWDVARDVADLDVDITGSEANLQMYFPLDKVAGVGFKDVTGNYYAELKGIEWAK